MEIKEFINMNPDEIWDYMLEFSPLYAECTEEMNGLSRELASAKAKLELHSSAIRKKIRVEPMEYGFGKGKRPTISDVETIVTLNHKYTTLAADIVRLTYELDCAKGNLKVLGKFHEIMIQTSKSREYGMLVDNSTKSNVGRKVGKK